MDQLERNQFHMASYTLNAIYSFVRIRQYVIKQHFLRYELISLLVINRINILHNRQDVLVPKYIIVPYIFLLV